MPGLRAKGEGSIYPFRDGYAGSVELKASPGEKRRRKVVYGRTPQEVAERMKTARAEAAQGLVPTRQRTHITINMLLDEWLEHINRPSSRLRELTRYQYGVEARRIRRFIGGLPIKDLTEDVISDWQASLLEEYSPRTVTGARTVLAAVILLARRKKLLPSNPMELVRPPAAAKPNKRAISGDEAGRFLRAIQGHPLETLFLADLLVGNRRGELLAWTWTNLDLERATVRIDKQVQRLAVPGKPTRSHSRAAHGTSPQLVRLKTDASARNLPLPSFLVDRLRILRNQREPGVDLIWSTRGKPMNPHRYNRAFKAVVEAAGLAPLTPHELRHSVATVMIALGVPAVVTAQYLGHSDPSVSLRWYTHEIPEALRDAAARMDGYIRRLADEHTGGNGYLERLSHAPTRNDSNSNSEILTS